MPELPEVETARRGIEPALLGRQVVAVRVRERRLRQPVPQQLGRELTGQPIVAVERRAKYLLLRAPAGTAILHLGMSGSLRLVPQSTAPERHDHVDIVLDSGIALRFRDPRRFGLLLWTRDDPAGHPLLRHIGPEPLGPDFSAGYLRQVAHGRRSAIKPFLMEAAIVAGVGNIYASEALWLAGVHPLRAAGRIALPRHHRIVDGIRQVLTEAIEAGGTTLRDFHNQDGDPGWFVQRLRVYGRGGLACEGCGGTVRCIRQAQRATWYCATCQT